MSYLRNHKLLLLIIGVLLVANIGLLYYFVFNRPSHPPKLTEQEMRDRAKEKVKNEVGLNAEQVAVYDSLRSNQFKIMKPYFEDITKSKEDFFSLIYQQNVSDSVLNAYASRIGEKQMALDLSTFRYFQSIKALCTEEQKPKMDSFIKQIVKRIINNGPRRPATDKKDRK
jgi:periplasmic protein CpxP/Spy